MIKHCRPEACEQVYFEAMDQGYCVTMPSTSALTYEENKVLT
ncbi:MAG: hypothetical protein ACLU4N_26170 [Butyricimonas faecihominis]